MKTKLQVKNLDSWTIINNKKPNVIAGPCSAETEEQTLKSAKELKQIGIEIFRAGIWKPRTRPNTFEGVGSIGLEWMKTVKKETGMNLLKQGLILSGLVHELLQILLQCRKLQML